MLNILIFILIFEITRFIVFYYSPIVNYRQMLYIREDIYRIKFILDFKKGCIAILLATVIFQYYLQAGFKNELIYLDAALGLICCLLSLAIDISIKRE